MIRHASELLNGQLGLVSQGAFASLGDDQVGLNLEFARNLQ
jgi:hypothetical protein